MARDVTGPREAEADRVLLPDEQAALRRVATLVARGAPPAEIFVAIAAETGRLLDADEMWMARYEGDTEMVIVARTGGHEDIFSVGSRWPLGGENVITHVFRTGKPARVDDDGKASGPVAEAGRSTGLRALVGTPILVRGRLWGVMLTGTFGAEAPPPDTDSRLSEFTELMALAIANAEARSEVERLAQEQAALRRVATMVARERPPQDILAQVAQEVMQLLHGDVAAVLRYESDGRATILATAGELGDAMKVGSHWDLDCDTAAGIIYQTRRPARIDTYDTAFGSYGRELLKQGVRSTVGSPIFVGGALWGTVGVASQTSRMPDRGESQLAEFAELAATAISNLHARGEVQRLAEEQTALGRVATLVADGAAPDKVFDAVAAEIGTLLEADGITLVRYEQDDQLTVMAHGGPAMAPLPTGTRIRHDGASVSAAVRRTRRPATMSSYAGTHGQIGDVIGGLRLRSGVGAPIVVDGRLWGATIANWVGADPPAPGIEARMAKFARLLGTAIANADSRDQLTASRARLVTEADDARRRVVRDLHDGAQQRLVHTVLSLKRAQRALREGDAQAESLVDAALESAQRGTAELRELAHGILPAALTNGGLRAGINAVVNRLDLPVEVRVPTQRFPPEIEASAYFVIAEALTNVVKHSQAARAEIRVYAEGRTLHIEVRDDGVGGADPGGHGLIGLRDRVTALGGQLTVTSAEEGGTVVSATLPIHLG